MREETGTGARRSWPMDMALLWAAGAGSRWDRWGPAGTGGVPLGQAGSRWDRRGPAGTGRVLLGQSGRGTEHAWELSQPRGKTLGCSSFTSGSQAEGGWQLQLLPLTLALRESPQAGHGTPQVLAGGSPRRCARMGSS